MNRARSSTQRSRTRRAAGRERRFPKHILPCLLVAYACLLPRELSLDFQGGALPPYRLFLFLFTPVILSWLARNPIRISPIDLLAGFVAVWYPFSLWITEDAMTGIVKGGALGADFGLAYLIGRALVRTSEDFRQFFVYLLPGLVIIALIMAAESLSHTMFLRPELATILGRPEPHLRFEIRMGLMRAAGPFPHPILGGVFLASLLPFALYLARPGLQKIVALCVAASAIFTVSSGAILGFALGGGLIFIDYLRRLLRLPLFMLATFYAIAGALLISLLSQNGLFSFISRRLTLTPGTAYYRQLIWEYAGAEVVNHPFFGIGLHDWKRPSYMPSDTVDAQWLLLSLKHGLPLGIGCFLVIVLAALRAYRVGKFGSSLDRAAANSLAFALIIIVYTGFTVALWEGINAWMVMLSGMAVALQASVPGRIPLTAQERGSAPATTADSTATSATSSQ